MFFSQVVLLATFGLTAYSAAAFDVEEGYEEVEPGRYFELGLFISLACVANLSSSYLQESYQRRKYAMLLRLKEERRKTDSFLNLILHEAAVAQMKQGFQVAFRQIECPTSHRSRPARRE